MATPTWNQITAPNFSAGNSLIVQAMDQLTKAGEGLQGVAKDYKDTLYKRNLGAIQEYVNSAKTPEELESEGFRTGLARLTGTMAGEYDTLAKAQVVDKAKDTLLSRKANQVSIARNEFGLNQDQLEANQKQAISNIFAINDPDMRKAAIGQAVKDKQFNSSLYLQTLAAELTGKTNQQTYDFNTETWDTRKEALTLGNDATRNRMKNDDRTTEIAAMNAETNRLQAEAAAKKAEEEKNKNKNAHIGTGFAAIDNARKAVKEKVYGSGLTTDPTKTLKYWKDESTAGLDSFDAAPDYIYEAITKHPELSKLPQNIQQLFAQNTLSGVRDSENFSRPFGAMSGAEKAKVHELLTEEYKNFNQQVKTAEDNATIPIYRKTVFEHAQKTGAKDGYAAAKDLGLDELTIYKAGIPSQLAAEAKIKYASSDKSIPENQFIENEINIATNPDYAASNAPLFPESKAKAIPSETIKFNSPAMQMAGFADYGTAFRFEEREAEKAAQQLKASAKANQAQTGNSLQQTALPPNVNKLISTPLDIVTNPSTIKTKPVADPLRQAALEQTPVATNNISQPRQLPPAEIAQKETKGQAAKNTTALQEQEARMQNRARLSLEAQKALQNGQPFIVPAITDKLEETKPRELTPAEKQQAERMNQEALVRLPGTKLKEKQAEVQKQFPDTPLKQQAEPRTQTALSNLIGAKLEEKQALVRKLFPNASLTPINKATELLGNNSEPLIQSMFKLPVATDNTSQPKSINKAATAEAKEVKQSVFPDTPLKQLAKAATPVPSPLIPVESQNAFRVKENNLALDFRTGKGTPTKEPVPMPKVTWKEPVQAVTINPIYAQLPQHKVVATFVPDGDTINATSDTYKTKGERAKKAGGIICRIDSIETPETAKPQYGKKGQPYGAEAAKILQQMVLNKEISIRVTKPTDGESNYGRDVCQIEVAGKDVSVELLRAGAAWLYKEYNHYGQGGLDLEATARESKSGLWGLGNPVYPPDFRHNGYQNP